MKPVKTVFVRAAPGRRVKDPLTLKVLDDVGEEKPRSSYWERRIRDHDVIEGAIVTNTNTIDTNKQTRKHTKEG